MENDEELRDLFAIAALIGLGNLIPSKRTSAENMSYYALRARYAYEQADAMMAARKVKSE